jgi:hypothetical protein
VKRHALIALFLAAACASGVASAADEPPPTMKPAEFLRPGEALVFNLTWGFISAGETRLETVPLDLPEGPRLRVDVRTRSKGIADAIYPLRNDSTCLIDLGTGRTLMIEVEGKEGKKPVRKRTVFDYEKGEVVHTDEVKPSRSGTAKLPDGPVYDLMVTVMQVRSWNMQPGEKRRVLCVVEDDIYDLELTAGRAQKIKTPAGTFEAVDIEPKQIGELKGIFRKGGSMRYWISRGDKPQIVRMDFKANFGTFTASLASVGTVPPAPAKVSQSN